MELTWKKDEVILTQKTLIETMQQMHLPNISDQIGNKPSLPSNMTNYEPMAEDEKHNPTEQKPYQSLIGEFVTGMWYALLVLGNSSAICQR